MKPQDMRVLRATVEGVEGFRVHLVEAEWDALVWAYDACRGDLAVARIEMDAAAEFADKAKAERDEARAEVAQWAVRLPWGL